MHYVWDNNFDHICIRPMIVIGGSSEQDQEGMDAFQECPQVTNNRQYSNNWYIRDITRSKTNSLIIFRIY